MTAITNNTIEYFNDFYSNKTTKTTGPRAELRRYLESNIGNDLKTTLKERIDASVGRTWIQNIKWCLSNMAKKSTKMDEATRQVFREVCDYIQEEVIGKMPFRPCRIAPTQAQIDEDIAQTDDPVKKALKKLFRAGLKREDLMRDYFKLAKVHEGTIVVTMNCGRTQPRIIEATTPRFGLTVQECNEIIPILRGKIVKCDDIGLGSVDCFQDLVQGWKFSPGVLRFAHGEHLSNLGYTDAEVAELHGITKEGVRNRRRRYKR